MGNHGYNDDMSPEIKAQFNQVFGVHDHVPHDAVSDLAARREIEESFLRLQQKHLGPTGRFPLGKISDSDDGEIRIAIAADPTTKTIIFNFGTLVRWIAFPREDAKKLAEVIVQRLRELE